MAFEFGLFQEFPRYPAQTDADAFAQSFAQADAAERWGLDAVWLAELHFAPERSVASAPLVLASAMAARTRRVKIGRPMAPMAAYVSGLVAATRSRARRSGNGRGTTATSLNL